MCVCVCLGVRVCACVLQMQTAVLLFIQEENQVYILAGFIKTHNPPTCQSHNAYYNYAVNLYTSTETNGLFLLVLITYHIFYYLYFKDFKQYKKYVNPTVFLSFLSYDVFKIWS